MTASAWDVDAVVIAFHGDRWLAQCIDFLRDPCEAGVRIVLGDNFGNTVVSSLTDGRRIISVPLRGPLGFAEANNQTLVRIGLGARYICFLNQDTKSPRGWLTSAAQFLDEHSDIGAITPLISTYDGKGWDPNFVACTKTLPGFLDVLSKACDRQRFYEVPVIPAPAMIVRTSVLRKVGGFDPIYGSYYEDYDLCRRILEAGYRVGIWTGATVAHFSGSATATSEAERRRQRLIVRNRIIYRVRGAKDGRIRQLAQEWFIELPRQITRRLLRRPASKPLGVLLSGHWDSVRLSHRLISAKHDDRLWRKHLVEIGWNLTADCPTNASC